MAVQYEPRLTIQYHKINFHESNSLEINTHDIKFSQGQLPHSHLLTQLTTVFEDY